MSQIDLKVPFAEKDEAQRLGARWDRQRGTWYIPDGRNSTAFAQWLPKADLPESPTIRATAWSLVSSQRKCWRCKKTSRVFAILLTADYETRFVADDPADDCWTSGDGLGLLSYVTVLPESIAAQLRLLAPRYRLDHTKMVRSSYWMNHCEHCDAKLGDYETLEEPGTFYDLRAGLEYPKLIANSFHAAGEAFTCCSGHMPVEI